MKALEKIGIFLITLIALSLTGKAEGSHDSDKSRLNINNISSFFYNSGIFDHDLRTSNGLGFEWPKGSGKSAVFTAGITLAALMNNNELRMASASYKGELAPSCIYWYNGQPVVFTDNTFRMYKITRGDNINNNPDWAAWTNMVPHGAPFIDVNHNGIYEPAIDTPGIRFADQTIFICMTDGFPNEHKIGEGFGGGTAPMFAEVQLTAWAYNRPGLEDMQFIKWVIINKNVVPWSKTYMAIIADPDIGNRYDDYIGCDTTRKLGFCYNGDNFDSVYGANPPAFGFRWLNCSGANNLGPKSFTYFTNNSGQGLCERVPNGEYIPAYYMLKGLKKDQTPWVIPPGGSTQYITKFCYSGDPETGTGWNEGQPGNPSGSVLNCGGPGYLTGTVIPINPAGDRFMIMSSGSDYNTVFPNDTVRIIIAQLIARGSSNLNSVTELKQLSDVAQQLCNNGFVIGVNNISTEIPNSFMLYQNYPNPFNPVTKIKFDLPKSNLTLSGTKGLSVRLIIYDALGREVSVLVNDNLKPGTYEAEWDGTNYPSGVYFYKLTVSDASSPAVNPLSITKKMVLLK